MHAGDRLVVALFFNFGKSVVIREEFAQLARQFEDTAIFVEMLDNQNQRLFDDLQLSSLTYQFYRNGKRLHQIQGPVKMSALQDKIVEFKGKEKDSLKKLKADT